MNRVLTLAEVLALEDGAEVWVEHNTNRLNFAYPDEVHVVGEQDGELALHSSDDGPWLPKSDVGWFGVHYRVWSLPQPPSAEELSANPWRKEEEANECY